MTPAGTIHIRGTLDAQVDLLDRQVVSSDGRMIAKVDDVELEERADGTLIVSGILVGPGALGPRLGRAANYVMVHTWSRLSGRDPGDPQRIDYAHIADISTVLTLDEVRRAIDIDGLETWARLRVIDALPGAGGDPDSSQVGDPGSSRLENGPARRGERRRFSQLAGMRIRFADGRGGDQVTDVRFAQANDRGHLPKLTTDGLIVGRNRPGSLFGYDRNRQQGPWVVQMILRFVHRHTGYVPWSDVASIDWDEGVLTLRTTQLELLTGL